MNRREFLKVGAFVLAGLVFQPESQVGAQESEPTPLELGLKARADGSMLFGGDCKANEDFLNAAQLGAAFEDAGVEYEQKRKILAPGADEDSALPYIIPYTLKRGLTLEQTRNMARYIDENPDYYRHNFYPEELTIEKGQYLLNVLMSAQNYVARRENDIREYNKQQEFNDESNAKVSLYFCGSAALAAMGGAVIAWLNGGRRQ